MRSRNGSVAMAGASSPKILPPWGRWRAEGVTERGAPKNAATAAARPRVPFLSAPLPRLRRFPSPRGGGSAS